MKKLKNITQEQAKEMVLSIEHPMKGVFTMDIKAVVGSDVAEIVTKEILDIVEDYFDRGGEDLDELATLILQTNASIDSRRDHLAEIASWGLKKAEK